MTSEATFSKTPRPKVEDNVASRIDTDKDGIFDEADRCPYLAEDIDNYRDKDGCPDPDNDNDGYADFEDKAPLLPEDFDGFEDHDGAPESDNDGDGLSDGLDRCPNHSGLGDGCPESTFVWRDYIERTENRPPNFSTTKNRVVLHKYFRHDLDATGFSRRVYSI